ncbi:MAG TPA: DUF3105 domain-containing protein [Gaiella sp.]|jgi:hypothetical protein
MPPKPRTAKPRPRKGGAPVTPSGGTDRKLVYGIAAAGIVALAAVLGWLALSGGGSGTSAADARAALEAADCTLRAVEAQPGVHSITSPAGTSKAWNTNPPTSGAHYEIPAVWGSYKEPLNPAQVVHNLEHGGIFIQYGSRVPEATVAQLESFYNEHRNGTLLAPLPQPGDEIVLGAWTTVAADKPEDGTAYVARCRAFDRAAFDAFFSAFQFKGPERFPASTMLPGRT